MSGGRLVVLDRSGRDGKRYPLASGYATLGSTSGCDIIFTLPSVCPRHATVTVHDSQTVIRNVGDGETLVNGQRISVAALRHGDIITLGDRSLRWEYTAPTSPGLAPLPVSRGAAGRARGPQRSSAGAAPVPRDRSLQLAIEMNHRASMPASSGGKQVAIVQPQRRDTNEQTGNTPNPTRSLPRRSKSDLDSVEIESDKRKSRVSPKTVPANTTKATLWIESRKAPPPPRSPQPPARRSLPGKKSTPLRRAVLKKAMSAHKLKVVKIEAPLKIDHTKQAAIMLMTGHTPKSRLGLSQPKKSSPSYVIKKPSPVPARKSSARKVRQSGRGSEDAGDGLTPKRASTYAESRRTSKRNSGNKSATILEISDSTSRSSIRSNPHTPLLPSPKKSALKDLSKKGNRKTESIKFDLSNLENYQETEITSRFDSEESMSEDDLTLQYSESSHQSPSPRRSINSRSSIIMEKLGSTLTLSPSRTLTRTPNSPSWRKSARGSMLVQKALDTTTASDYTKSHQSANATRASAYKTRTLSPRTRNVESYSIVDLVSIDSDTSKSVYNSADSTNTTDYGTPNESRRKTRSTINPTLVGCSTPYAAPARAARSRSNPSLGAASARGRGQGSASTRRCKSLSTPDNKHISVNSTRVSRASRSRSRINDSDLLLLDDTELEDSSPKTSKRSRTKSGANETYKADDINGSEKDGISTPENLHGPAEAGTPVLSIQSLLDASRSSLTSQKSLKQGRKPINYKRKTIGAVSEPRRRPIGKSKSLGMSARKTVLRLRTEEDSSDVSDRTDEGAPQPDNEDTVTPKSAVKLVPEAVKNMHSTAKKPQSKRSMIDDLDRSDIVKQLFNSPVKRKLSRSMTEFSRKQLFDDDEIVIAKRPTRNTIALTGRSHEDSISERSGTFTPEMFVSPISTPSNSPNLSGIKRLFQKNTPENDLRNVRGVKSLLRTHRTRRSAKNDLTNVTGLKLVFRKSPKNRLSDVRVKEVFKPSPKNDLRRVSGVKTLFQRETSPKNDLTDVRGVKKLFRKSPNNDLRNVSGVKRTLRNSPKNDLTDVRGVRKMFRHGKKKDSLHDVSGVEELFDTSNHSNQHCENLFDQWVGKPTSVRSVYSNTFSTKMIQKPKNRKGSLHSSLDGMSNNVEEWLEQELQKRFHREEPPASKSRNTSRNTTKELQNLITFTVEGDAPIRGSRTRNSSMAKKSASEIYSAHTLPIKKRSLVETSMEMCKPKLPIKKRAVVHSTPMKGRVSVTMNASELGRVSPIAAVDKTSVEHDTSLTRATRRQETVTEASGRSFRTKTPQKTPSKPNLKVSPRKTKSPKASPKTSKPTPRLSSMTPKPTPKTTHKTPNPSPRLTPRASNLTPKSSKPTKASPQKSKVSPKPVAKTSPKRVTRNRKNTTSENNTKKRRSSLVIGKKAPIMSPKADPKSKEVSIASPVKRTTRAKKEPKVVTPKRTRVRAQKATVVVPKPSPKLKPQGKAQALSQTEEKPRRTRKNTTTTVEAEPQPKKTRGKQNLSKDKENKTDNVPTEKPKRGRKTVAEETDPPANKRGRGRNTKQTSVQEVKTRGKSVAKADKPDEKLPKPRGKKVETQTSVQSEPTTRRTRKNTENVSLQTQPKTRGKKQAEPAQTEPKPRGKKAETLSTPQAEPRRTRAAEKARPEPTGRKRKTVAIEEVPPKIAKTATRREKTTPVTVEPVKASKVAVKDTGRSTRAKDKPDSKEEAKPRGRSKTAHVEVVKPTATATRGKKFQAQEPKASPVAHKRKRKTKAEPSPAKGKKSSTDAVKRTRPAQQPAESTAPSGRSRRR